MGDWDDYKSALGWKVPSRHGGKLAAIAGLMEASNDLIDDVPFQPRFDISEAVRHLSRYGDPKMREAMEKMIRPPMVRTAIPEASWRNLRDGAPILPGHITYVDRSFAEPAMSKLPWSDLADQIAAGASPLQLILAPGGGPSRI